MSKDCDTNCQECKDTRCPLYEAFHDVSLEESLKSDNEE